ncbi:hypothetical protein [Novosphingobium sp.]|uniref:hypothetical protein n=1 Tax=Novosphingobium sp. TaxID=1874826 RepID=UPI0038B77099
MIEAIVSRRHGKTGRTSAGVHNFQFLPQIGHIVEIIEPPIWGRVVEIIHSSSKMMQQTELVIVEEELD